MYALDRQFINTSSNINFVKENLNHDIVYTLCLNSYYTFPKYVPHENDT